VGDVPQAQTIARKAAAQAPLDTILNSVMLATVNAAIQLQMHEPKAAIHALEETRPLDYRSDLELAPAYYRGLAYLQDKQPRRAAEKFQRVIAHRTLADFRVYVVLSELELGRTFQLLGGQVECRESLQRSRQGLERCRPQFPSACATPNLRTRTQRERSIMNRGYCVYSTKMWKDVFPVPRRFRLEALLGGN
jgi:hypothetical protein